MKRREFLKTSSIAGGAVLSSWAGGEALAQEAPAREFYELRVYEMQTGNRRAVLNEYLEKAFIPALNRIGSKPVGVFPVVSGSNALISSCWCLMPASRASWRRRRDWRPMRMYQKTAAAYLSATNRQPGLHALRVDAALGVQEPAKVRVPAETAGNKPRIFELRIYESHGEAAALRKIEMFNEGGEIAIFDKVGLRSVFFGQTLVGQRQPNSST